MKRKQFILTIYLAVSVSVHRITLGRARTFDGLGLTVYVADCLVIPILLFLGYLPLCHLPAARRSGEA